MKRIAYISADPGVPVFGTKGCSVHVMENIRALRSRGAHVTLFAQRVGGTPPADLADVPLQALPLLKSDSVFERERCALAANGVLRERLDAEGPFDIVYERYSLWGYAGMDYAREMGIPGILEVNAPLIEEQRKHRVLYHEREARHVALRVTTDASALIAVSDSVAAYLATFPGASDKIHVIPNGVDPSRFYPRQDGDEARSKDAFTVGFVGTLKPWHGVLDLVEGFSILHDRAPQSRLLIVGDGPERALIEARLAAQGLTLAARFTGAVHPDEVPRLIASMDVAVAPYPPMKDCYFSPLKAFEYMASGVAFVGSDIGQLSRVVTHERNGLLYPPGDTWALGESLWRLYMDIDLRKKLGRAARETVLRSHTWDAVGARILQIAGRQNIWEAA